MRIAVETAFTMLPCGCVVDIHGMNERTQEERGVQIVECQFCCATMNLDELEEWTRENRHEIVARLMNMIHRIFPVIVFEGKVLEVIEICNCGWPVVRAMDDRKKLYHLRVPQAAITRLRN